MSRVRLLRGSEGALTLLGVKDQRGGSQRNLTFPPAPHFLLLFIFFHFAIRVPYDPVVCVCVCVRVCVCVDYQAPSNGCYIMAAHSLQNVLNTDPA